MLTATAEGAALFTFVFLLKRIYKLTDLLVTGGSTMFSTIQLISSILPSIMTLTIPMAVLLAALMVYGRMAHDNEITALYAGRYSTFQLLIPAILTGVLLTGLMMWWSHRIVPKGLRNSVVLAADVLHKTATAMIQPGSFNPLGNMIILPGSVDEREMRSVRLFEKNGKRIAGVVSAVTGTPSYNPSTNSIDLLLEKGVLHQIPSEDRDVMIRFDTMNFSIQIPRMFHDLADMGREVHHYTGRQLKNYTRKGYFENKKWYYYCKIELAQRRAMPFACLIMAVLGALLGLQSRYGKRSANYATTIIIIFFYYILLSFGHPLAEKGNLPAWIALWIPNAVSMILAAYLYYRTCRI